jgi:hypothetical protein
VAGILLARVSRCASMPGKPNIVTSAGSWNLISREMPLAVGVSYLGHRSSTPIRDDVCHTNVRAQRASFHGLRSENSETIALSLFGRAAPASVSGEGPLNGGYQ